MKRSTLIIILAIITISTISGVVCGRDELAIWKEFVIVLKKDEFPIDKIRSYHESLSVPLLSFLNQMRAKATWEEWESDPEIYPVGNQVHFLIPLSFNNQKATYCFSFLVEGKNWYFQHVEAITIRLDQISSLPTSNFPDLPEEQKAWMLEEIRVSHQVRMFNLIAKEKGLEFAFNWFKDGTGYVLAARTWVPFFPVPKAFILYLCWEQSNLRGSKVSLEVLDDNQATVIIIPNYFRLYDATGHLKQQISFEDYRKLFETIWLDRAINAGWELEIEYEDERIRFNFRKTP